MNDSTEPVRRAMIEAINSAPKTREELVAAFGADQVWDTAELQRDFTVLSFLAPVCSVVRKSDGERGLVIFQHSPRFYFLFEPTDERT